MQMPYKRVCSYDDLDLLFREYTKTIVGRIKELGENGPTEQEYKLFWEKAMEKLRGIKRCEAIYKTGKHEGDRCQASPDTNSKYCRKHKHLDPEIRRKEAIKFYKENPEFKKDIELTEAELAELELSK
jgi:hypothetical protein